MPRQMSQQLSRRQDEMRQLAAQVGYRYSRAPGVVSSGLDSQSFVHLFTTMIHRESNFNPTAVSPAGAKGLGQLMPATARELGVCNVYSAEANLDGAARYLTQMMREFRSPVMALAAYNAGPGAVRKYDGIPPFSETRQYVSDILTAASERAASDRLGQDYNINETSAWSLRTSQSISAIQGYRPQMTGDCLALYKISSMAA